MITDDNNDNITDDLINENMILKTQLSFLMECIKNQMKNLEILCENSRTNFINKEQIKPYYEKMYKCNIYM
jgi:hypothetical protein